MTHQFSIFPFKETKPVHKVPISAERIREVKALIEKKKDGKSAVAVLREVRYGLENHLKRITNGK